MRKECKWNAAIKRRVGVNVGMWGSGERGGEVIIEALINKNHTVQ